MPNKAHITNLSEAIFKLEHVYYIQLSSNAYMNSAFYDVLGNITTSPSLSSYIHKNLTSDLNSSLFRIQTQVSVPVYILAHIAFYSILLSNYLR